MILILVNDFSIGHFILSHLQILIIYHNNGVNPLLPVFLQVSHLRISQPLVLYPVWGSGLHCLFRVEKSAEAFRKQNMTSLSVPELFSTVHYRTTAIVQ